MIFLLRVDKPEAYIPKLCCRRTLYIYNSVIRFMKKKYSDLLIALLVHWSTFSDLHNFQELTQNIFFGILFRILTPSFETPNIYGYHIVYPTAYYRLKQFLIDSISQYKRLCLYQAPNCTSQFCRISR